jgi:hypothetical protein
MIAIERGLTYTALDSPDENDWPFLCDSCGAVADVTVDPFPHDPDCPMKKPLQSE